MYTGYVFFILRVSFMITGLYSGYETKKKNELLINSHLL